MLAILYYHRVGPFQKGEPRKLSVTSENFSSQMLWLKRTKIPVHSLDVVTQAKPPKKGVVLTFDDGYEDVYRYAFPPLRECGFSATFFIVTSYVGKADAFNALPQIPRRPLMSWTQVRALSQANMTIGSHSTTHRDMTRLSLAEAEEEIRESKTALEEKLGASIKHFSYPYGRCNAELEKFVQKSGYLTACGTRSGNARNRFRLQRIPVSANDTLLEFAGKVLKGIAGYYHRQ